MIDESLFEIEIGSLTILIQFFGAMHNEELDFEKHSALAASSLGTGKGKKGRTPKKIR